MEKLFLIEIDSLDNENECYAGNKYFSEFFDISKGRCTQIIKKLEGKGLIEITIHRKGKAIVKRTIRVVNKLNNPIKFSKQPYLENDAVNNTSNNNTNKQSVDWSNLIILFNNITSKKTKVIPEKARRQILSRLKEGWTKDDIKKAIRNCYNDEHHINTKHKYCTLEFISRPEKFERFATMKPEKTNYKEGEETDEERAARLLDETKKQ